MTALTAEPSARHGARGGRSRDCAFYCPRQFRSAKPTPKNLFGYARDSGQFSKGVCLSAKHECLICEAVIRLLTFCCPAAIRGFVASVIVYPLYRVFSARPLTHIVKKIGECTPSITHGYATFLVVVKGWVRWLRASGNHVLPGLVCRGLSSLSCVSVSRTSPRASACINLSCVQINGPRDSATSTIALAFPCCVSAFGSGVFHNNEFAEPVTNNIFEPSASGHRLVSQQFANAMSVT